MLLPPFLALSLWPVASFAFFRRYRLPLALCLTLLGGYLLLPEKTSFDLPLLPAFDKDSVPALAALLMLLILAAPTGRGGREKPSAALRPGLLPRHPVALVLIAILGIGAFMTILTNGDPIFHAGRVYPGMRLYDGFSEVLSAIMAILPLLMARKVLARPEDHRLALTVFAFAGIAYSFPALFEVRMSPQLHTWVYGFFQHSFVQHYRGNGIWRPVVFLPHGLWLSIFFTMTALAALGLWRLKASPRKVFGFAALWLLATLFFSRSLGAMLIYLTLLPVILLLSARQQLLAATTIAAIFLTYPVLRSADLVPIERVVAFAETINANRANSLRIRIENEDAMLARALERPIFGWGGWGRSRTVTKDGVQTTPIADGYWTIVLGVGGWARYIAEVGLLTMPIFLFAFRRRPDWPGMETSIIAIMLTANLTDMIPNATITPVTWLLAGCLWGRVELTGAEASAAQPAAGDRKTGYRRATEEAAVTPAGRAEEDAEPPVPRAAYTRQTRRITRNRRER